jgi:hypothetical protein
MSHRGRIVASTLILLLAAVANGCEGGDSTAQQSDLEARSSRVFTAQDGWLDIEDEYLARVCTQENGAADYEALEAQVIAARTYLLRAMRDDPQLGTEAKPVVNGESFQAYAATANPGCRQAQQATRGVVMTWSGELIIANYVAGALVRPDGSIGKDLTHTEHFVTYNEGKSGGAVAPAPYPIAHPDRSDNRGCMGQNRADYLSEHGQDAAAILRYFYGEDITLVGLGDAQPGCDIDPDGTCHDGVLFFCDGDRMHSVDCAANGRACEPATSGAPAQCSAETQSTACGTVSYEGTCDGDVLSWCNDQGQLVVEDCAADGLTCGSDRGGKACVPPVEGSCADGTVEPQCYGTIYLRCRGDEMAFIDCATLGKACGYYEDSVDCLEVVR